jgi:1,4-alpha-glucan branching enzyme
MNQTTSSPAEKKISKSAASPRRSPPHRKSTPPLLAATPALQPVPSVSNIPAALDLHTVRIGYFQPEAREVYVAGSFNDWEPRETPLLRDSFGDWSVDLSLPPGEHRYRLVVDGEWRDDPSAQRMEANPYGGFDAVIVV